MLKRLITVCLILTSGATFGQSAATKYINAYKEAAIQMMNEHDVPASIILGIAIHESGSGTSKIARYLNNHFGIKGSTGPKTIKSAYKGYHSVEDSYLDFVNFLQRRSHLNILFEKYGASNYAGWIKTIQRGGYAHSKTWGSQVLAIIRKYKLYEYDEPNNTSMMEPKPVIMTEKALKSEMKSTSYIVKKGDTLSSIAKKHQTTVESIKAKNNLKSSFLKLGQELII